MTRQRLEKIWNQVPPNYYEREIATNPLKRYWHTLKVEAFKEITEGKKFRKILDVGCASGRMSNEISKIFPQAKIIGIDAYTKAIKFGKKHYPRLKLVLADAHQLPFGTNTFDLVICYETIEHVINPAGVLAEIRRVLAKNGRAIIAMDSGSFMFRVIWWICEKTICKVWQDAHLHPFKHHQLENLIKQSGFKIMKKQMSHYGMEVSFLLRK